VALCTLVAGSGYGYLRYRFAQIRRLHLRGLAQGADTSKAMTVLIVGSDSRAELAAGQESRFGTSAQVGGARSDVVMLLRVDPVGGRAAILSVPRDLYVPIAGTAGSDRINAAFAGGPDQLIDTIRTSLGIPVDHYVEVNFDGFRAVVDALGGLDVPFPAPARDVMSGLDIRTAGCIHLDGDAALAYVRSRHYESYEAGRWRSDPTSDLGRMQRQQDFIRRMMAQAITRGIRNPLTANAVVGAAASHLSVDSGLSPAAMLRLGQRLRTLEPAALETATLPVAPAVVSGADVLHLSRPQADEAIDRFLHGPPPPPPPPQAGDVRVLVLNGSGRPGQAAAAAQGLRQRGFVVVGTSDADNSGYTTTTIRFAPAHSDRAALVQGVMRGGTDLRADTGLGDVDVAVVTGSGFDGIRSPREPVPPLPVPTTARGAPTTVARAQPGC